MTVEKPLAVITGAAGGIGRALTKRLAKQGWRLHLCDVGEDHLVAMQADLPDDTTYSITDLGDLEACRNALPQGSSEINAIVHLAGIFEFHKLTEQDRSVYERTIQHNQTNAYDLTVAAEPVLADNGRVVFASSLAFNRGAADAIAYTMAKGALVGLTRALSRKLASRSITVNAVAPGLIETAMLRKVMQGRDEEAMRRSVPMGRFGEPDEVAGVIAISAIERCLVHHRATDQYRWRSD